MTETSETADEDPITSERDRMVTAILDDVAFDGWTAALVPMGAERTGVDITAARMAFPRGGLDMAIHFHRMGDRHLADELARRDARGEPLGAMRIRDRITHCVRRRIELIGDHREAVRRAGSLFALPTNAPEGMRLIWETADQIWTVCGDTSEDYNWYTKRGILASVYSATVLYWLGDQDPRGEPTWEFLDRRIENVMQFEQVKAQMQKNPVTRAAFAVPMGLLSMVRAPGAGRI